jgi:hypothetical protein
MKTNLRLLAVVASVLGHIAAGAPTNVPPWAVESYSDEAGFKVRAAATVPAIAQMDYKRSLAYSKCPDTGLPVRTLAVEGEEIISPYTGRRYRQGKTGYFGPKERDAEGRITQFGGDPMKFDLPPLTARMLTDTNDVEARAYLSIPGNLMQQYHFACVNWARFYPLLSDVMGEKWRSAFADAVAVYREGRRFSRESLGADNPRPNAHDLVGEESEFFGGNVADGGTENHKTMWRTSGLLYAQILGTNGWVSGYPAAEAERIVTKVLTRGWRDILRVGNGEWDSSIYYLCHIRGFMNLYDFSPRPETRDLARFALDFYYATYGLKVMNGHFIGPQKRGFVSGFGMGGMEQSLWAYASATTEPAPTNAVLSLHQATTRYRPNRVIRNIFTKNVPLPFEARMTRPTYHLKERNAAQETFYCDDGFALGSVALTLEDNPGQQAVWSLGCRHPAGTFIFGGGQPRFRSPEGHAPCTQVVQKRGALVVLTAGTNLTVLPPDVTASQRWDQAAAAAETWLFVPRGARAAVEDRDALVLDAGEAWVFVRPIGGKLLWLRGDPAAPEAPTPRRGTLEAACINYDILVVPGATSGYAIEAALKKKTADPKAFLERTRLTIAAGSDFRVEYRSLSGDTIAAKHEPAGMRASATINGEPVDWAAWAGGAAYASPYVTIRDGWMRVSDGREAYVVDLSGAAPVWKTCAVEGAETRER